MRVVPKAANDMMNVGRLQGFDVSIKSMSRDVQACLKKRMPPFSLCIPGASLFVVLGSILFADDGRC
jgi:hypothetical protein